MSAASLPFPRSLPEFQRMFPDDAACAAYLERVRWPGGFTCPKCVVVAEPFRFAARPAVLRCRSCRADTSLTANTVMHRTHTPLSIWFWGAYLMTTQTPGESAVQFQRQLGLTRYETAFQILHKLRAGMVRPNVDRIGARGTDVEMDECLIGGATRGEGRGRHHKVLVVGAVEVRERPNPGEKPRRAGKYAGRLRLRAIPDRTASSLLTFARESIAQGSRVITDDWSGYDRLAIETGVRHTQIAERGDHEIAETYLPLIHLVFSNLKAWLLGTHHAVSNRHLQAYLNEFSFRFNRRFYPFNSFRSLLGIGVNVEAPTYDSLYDGSDRSRAVGVNRMSMDRMTGAPLVILWVHGMQTYESPKPLVKTLRDIGGYLRIGKSHRDPLWVKIEYSASDLQDPWRVLLPVADPLSSEHGEVADFPTLREALAAASRWARSGARAVGESWDWKVWEP